MTNLKRAATLFMIFALVGSVFAAGFAGSVTAAEPTVETSSDLSSGSTWVDFNASSDDNKLIEFNNTDAADGGLVIWDPTTGTTPSEAQKHLELDNTSTEFESTSTGADSYAFNITGDQLQTVPMEAGENKTVTVTISNQSDWTASNANLTSFDITLDNTMERSVMYVGDCQIENDAYGLSHSNEEPRSVAGFDIPFTGNQQTSMDTSRTIDGSITTVYAYLANDSVDSHFSDKLGSLNQGEWTKSTLTQLGDSEVKNYAELPTDLDSETSTVKYDTSSSTNALVLDLGDSYDGETNVDMQVNSNPSWWEATSAYGFNTFGLFEFDLPGLGMIVPAGGALAIMVPIGRRRLGA